MSDLDPLVEPYGEHSNRYSKIHILFRELAKLKTVPGDKLSNVTVYSFRIKGFWKNFFGINSLTELSDKELHDLEHFMEERIKAEKKKT